EATDLLCHTIGTDRVRAERWAATELAVLTGRLPLTMRIVGERTNGRRATPLAAVVAELRAERNRLDEPSARDGNPRIVLSHSYQALDVPAARMFRLLGLNPTAD